MLSMMLPNIKLESLKKVSMHLKLSLNGSSQIIPATTINMPNAFPKKTELSPLLHQLKLSWVDAPETPTAPLTLMRELELDISKIWEDMLKKPNAPSNKWPEKLKDQSSVK
jgi:hypothetical protein